MNTPLMIEDEVYFWQLYENEGASLAFLGHMVGLDLLHMRSRYEEFCKVHGSANAAREKQILAYAAQQQQRMAWVQPGEEFYPTE
jgi:hypothetical protein